MTGKGGAGEEGSGRPAKGSRRAAEVFMARPGWQKALVGIALVIALAGLALQTVAWVTAPGAPDPAPERGATQAPETTRGLLPGDFPGARPGEDAPAPGAEETWLDNWSPAIFRLGFSFFVGFAIAFAARTFLKVSLVFAGVVLLALFGLQYLGVVVVDWGAMESHFDRTVAWLRDQTSGFTRFMSGYLPSAASGVAGLVVGFRRR